MRLLFIFGSTEGQTKKICEFLKSKAENAGHVATLCDSVENPPAPDGYDAVLIGASLHAEKYQAAVKQYVNKHQVALNAMLTAFVSVSLTAADNTEESRDDLNRVTRSFLEETGWSPDYIEQVAGALQYSKYNFLKKMIMRMIAKKYRGGTDTSRDYEYTDWEQVKGIWRKLEKSLAKAGR